MYSYDPSLYIKDQKQLDEFLYYQKRIYTGIICTIMNLENKPLTQQNLVGACRPYIQEWFVIDHNFLSKICTYNEKDDTYSLKQENKNIYLPMNLMQDTEYQKKFYELLKNSDHENLNIQLGSDFDLQYCSPYVKTIRFFFFSSKKVVKATAGIFRNPVEWKQEILFKQEMYLLRGVLEVLEDFYIYNKIRDNSISLEEYEKDIDYAYFQFFEENEQLKDLKECINQAPHPSGFNNLAQNNKQQYIQLIEEITEARKLYMEKKEQEKVQQQDFEKIKQEEEQTQNQEKNRQELIQEEENKQEEEKQI
ncbi:hypothetical protein PPERSA_01812 [Pseudocohnilembus persalinus]|uniref:Uncharacterized protein n=1 Tax=Pseudocohnilembus persalinus TaxID=266149 RepID=A0A0V0QKF2_PSEPJ|nr:hypothetical protein PPERSA_01812 [Pseudocohnilembus persalinus]|eukprot:KRX02695.1 hypothetical protein PPERSA_01812 [Pseudocohnilembus persalinus]